MAGRSGERLLTGAFLKVALVTLLYFISFGSTLAILVRYAEDELQAGTAMVGLIVGSLAVASVVVRPIVGQVGDRRGRRVLLLVGPLISAVGFLGIVFAHSWLPMVGTRLLVGAGQAAVMVGITTLAMDLAPAHRRGEASAYVLVAVHLGQGSAPIIGEWIVDTWSFEVAWCAAAAGSALASASALLLPRGRRASPGAVVGAAGATAGGVARTGWWSRLVHPAGIGPGVVVAMGLVGITGYNAFVPLYGEDVGLQRVGVVFMCSSLTIVVCRVFGGRLPDRLGAARGGSTALGFIAAGLALVAAWAAPWGMYLGTILMGVGASLLFPSLVVGVMDAVEDRHRAAAVATFTMFIDVANALGGLITGSIVALTSYRTAFATGALCALSGILVLRRSLVPRLAVAAARRAELALDVKAVSG